HGIALDNVVGPLSITGNRIDPIRNDGIDVDDIAGDVTITGNYITGAVSDTADSFQHAGITLTGFKPGFAGTVLIRSNTVLNSFNGIFLTDTAGAGQLHVNFNRIVDNSSAAIANASTSSQVLDAENNWFGCNAGPGNTGCGAISEPIPGSIDFNPWLVLGISADGQTVTADLTHNSAGQDTSGAGHIPDGTPVTFATSLGSV